MVPAAIIARKRDGGELTDSEIEEFLSGFVHGTVADYQMSAFAMAVVCRGMSTRETSCLTNAMLASGKRLPRTSDRPRVDKHSTGGLGDKTSLILAPLLACFDLDVPMLSGRGLGITGGTLDKLEAFPGYRCDLNEAEIDQQLAKIGCVITGTTKDIAPADRKLYALRDVTGTVESIALITASIMCKKMAESLDALVLDVKFGSAAFMQNLRDARLLAESLVRTGHHGHLPTRAILSDMNQPLGKMVGNACEVNEAIEMLQGGGPQDLREVTLRLCAELLVELDRASDLDVACSMLVAELDSGRPLQRFQQMVEAQHGKYSDKLPTAPAFELMAESDGFLQLVHGRRMGHAIVELGGGRKHLGGSIDHSVGLEMMVRVGDRVSKGQTLARVLAPRGSAFDTACEMLRSSMVIGSEPTESLPLVLEIS